MSDAQKCGKVVAEVCARSLPGRGSRRAGIRVKDVTQSGDDHFWKM